MWPANRVDKCRVGTVLISVPWLGTNSIMKLTTGYMEQKTIARFEQSLFISVLA